MQSKVVNMLVRFNQHSFIQAVRQTLVVLFPVTLIGALAQLVFSVLDLRVDAALNDDFPSDQRATLVSVNSMAYSLLMIAASPVAGAVGDALGTPFVFLFLGAGLAVCTVLGALWVRRRYRV